MDAKIQKRTENPHLQREEVECIIDFEEGTPKKEDIKALVAKTLTVNPSLLIINRMIQQFGSKQTKVVACVYKNAESLKRVQKETEEDKKEAKPSA